MKKTISVILCFVLVSCMLVGCGKKNSEETSKTTTDFQLKITMDSHYSDMDESSVRVYENLCDAIFSYETEVKFNTSLTDNVNQLFYTSFPLYTLVDGIDFLEDNSGVSITYALSKEEHLAKVEEFKTAVNEIMTQCGYGEVSNDTYLLNLYTYISKNVTIDNSVTGVLDTIVTKKGIVSTITGMFEYLLLQADIPASHIMNLNTNSTAKMLSMAQFNGEWYYFDPADEIEKTSGDGLMFFAMDTQRAIGESSSGFVYTDNTEPEEVSDLTYTKLQTCTSYTIDESTVTAKCKGEKDFVFDLK